MTTPGTCHWSRLTTPARAWYNSCMFDPANGADSQDTPQDASPSSAIVPSIGSVPAFLPAQVSSIPFVTHERGLPSVLRRILDRSGLSINEVADRCGVNQGSMRQYLNGRRSNPGVLWLTRFVEACGGKVVVEIPQRGRFR